MDKEVSLTIKVNTNGEDKIHNVKASASELAQTIKDVEDAHESLNKQVLNINQLQQAWSNLYEGCRQVADIVTGLTAAYNTQEQADVKLTTEEIKRRYREAMRKWKGTYNSSPQMTQAEKRHTPQQKIKR